VSAIPGGAMVIDASHGDYRAAGVLSSLTRGSDYRETAGGALELGGWGGLPAPRIAAPLVSSAAYCRGALVASERQTSPGVRVRLPQVVRLRALPHLGLREPLDIVIETDDVGFLAQSVDLPLYANGSDTKEAIEGLAHEIEILWGELQEDDAFTDEWLTYRSFLAKVIVTAKP